MNPLQKRAAAAGIALCAALAITACSDMSSAGDAPVSHTVTLPAVVFAMPDGSGNIARVCDGTEGIYTAEANSNGALFVVPSDPACEAHR